jgi:hypothetical protein
VFTFEFGELGNSPTQSETAMKNKLVYAIFWDEEKARQAVEELANAHFSADEVGVLLSKPDDDEVEEVPTDTETRIPVASAIGGALGAIGGALILTASGFMAAGPLLVALEGALAGGFTGSIAGALVGMGYWTEEIEAPDEELEEGAILVGASTHERVDDAREALESAGAEEVHVRTREEAEDELSKTG